MNSKDFQALTVSALFHALLFVGFLSIPIDLGRQVVDDNFIEVIMGADEITDTDFFPLPDPESAADEEEETAPPPQPEAEETETRTAQSRPVRTPTQRQPVRSNERVATPPTENVDPVTPPREGTEEPTRSNTESTNNASGQTTGTASQNSASNSENTSTSSSTTTTNSTGSPQSGFQVIGINRRVVRRSVPRHTQLVTSTIEVCITVNPQGNVVGKYICRKGNAALEQESLRAVSNWKFSALPQGAPQLNQNGRIRFRFVVE